MKPKEGGIVSSSVENSFCFNALDLFKVKFINNLGYTAHYKF